MQRPVAGSLGSGGLASSFGLLGALWAPGPLPWMALAGALALALLCPARLRWILLCLLLGAAWATLEAGQRLEARWPAERHGEDLRLRGIVADIPAMQGADWRFRFRPEGGPVAGDIRASWYRADGEIAAGDCLDLGLSMRAPRGSVSPGAFDYERWLLSEGYAATAYVREARRCGAGDMPWWRAARAALDRQLQRWLGEHPGAALLRALTVGNRNGIDDEDWQVLRVTGTTHLLAISGLHVGLVAGLALFAGRWLWRRSARLCARLPAPRAGVLIGSLAALGYAALAGFAVPTQRALLMWAVLALALWSARPVRPARVLLLAWLTVLAVDPLAVLSAGTWLSFVAVAAIVLISADRAAGLRAWLRIPRMQLALLIALAPATLLFFQGASLVAPLVNAVAIPLFALLLPLLLFAVVAALLGGGATALWPAAEALAALRAALGWIAEHSSALWLQAAPAPMAIAAAGLGAALLLTPQAVPLRGLALICFAPLLWPPAKLPHGQFELAALDVGQGLATVVRTRDHVLVYDAGPAWPGGFDAGAAIVTPWLRRHGVERIDRLLRSHEHADHGGGIASLADAFRIGQRFGLPESPACDSDLSWRWDGVRFRVLHPEPGAGWQGNNRSCVLRISAAGHAALLTGDIEAVVETRLARELPAASLRADVVVAPHHGSRSSSSAALVDATRPDHVLVPAGWRNRHGHPHPAVAARWRRVGAELAVTGDSGSLWIRLGRGVEPAPPERARDRHRLWRAPPPP